MCSLESGEVLRKGCGERMACEQRGSVDWSEGEKYKGVSKVLKRDSMGC